MVSFRRFFSDSVFWHFFSSSFSLSLTVKTGVDRRCLYLLKSSLSSFGTRVNILVFSSLTLALQAGEGEGSYTSVMEPDITLMGFLAAFFSAGFFSSSVGLAEGVAVPSDFEDDGMGEGFDFLLQGCPAGSGEGDLFLTSGVLGVCGREGTSSVTLHFAQSVCLVLSLTGSSARSSMLFDLLVSGWLSG